MQKVCKIWHCDLKTMIEQVAYRKNTTKHSLGDFWKKHDDKAGRKNNKLCLTAEKLKTILNVSTLLSCFPSLLACSALYLLLGNTATSLSS